MVRFGSFEFDAATRRLRRDGSDIHLPPKAFELLSVLVGSAPKVVNKRELHARLWPGGAVADATLVALVKQLRRALGDSDRRAPLIRTVHRVGYALEVPVSASERRAPRAAECWLMAGARRMPLAAGENLVGRDALARVRLDDPAVSRRHARITVQGGSARLADLGSKNGTFCEGQRLGEDQVVLQDGFRLVFGTVQLIYREAGSAGATLTQLNPLP